MASFPTTPSTTQSASASQEPHDRDPITIQSLSVSNNRINDILVQMEIVLNIVNSGQALYELLRAHVNCLTGENRPITQLEIAVHDSTKQQCNEAMAAFPEDLWNLACCGCRDNGYSLFTCRYLKMPFLRLPLLQPPCGSQYPRRKVVNGEGRESCRKRS